MIDVIYDFNERVSQIEKYLAFVWIIDNISYIGDLWSISDQKAILNDNVEIYLKDFLKESNSFVIDNELIKILKSNTILLLYNLIEGTISAVLNEFFGSINSEGCNYESFKLPIKKIWLKYKHRSFNVGEKKSVEYILETIENILNEVIDISPKSIKDSELGDRMIYNYEAYSSVTKSNEVSGNLDARKIRELFELYGLPKINCSCDSMVKVKNKRNSLSHGNETFAQVGSNFTIEELFRMKNEIKNFMAILLEETNEYLRNKRYLNPVE